MLRSGQDPFHQCTHSQELPSTALQELAGLSVKGIRFWPQILSKFLRGNENDPMVGTVWRMERPFAVGCGTDDRVLLQRLPFPGNMAAGEAPNQGKVARGGAPVTVNTALPAIIGNQNVVNGRKRYGRL